MRYYLGVDPGFTGALAFYDPLAMSLKIYDVPTIKIKKPSGGVKTEVDMYELARIIGLEAEHITSATIEKVTGVANQGVTSIFNFGFSTGVITMAIASYHIPIITVPPATWKRSFLLGSNKGESIERAKELFPAFTHYWKLKKHDGRAEAALIACYAATKAGHHEL